MLEVVNFKNISEKYRIKFVINGKEIWEDFWALKGISFSVKKAEGLAIIGENGAGKSTILKLIAGVLKADKGEVLTRGKISALLELGAGFHPDFTGRENLYLNASLFGLSKKDIDFKFNEIVEFSGIGRFIDAQVKSYSQGMFVRLAFAIAIHINPNILLVDDTLAVGDEDFQRKCIEKIFELKEAGKTIIFVTHDMNMARRLCKRGIFLRDGKIVKDGPIDMVISYYMETLGDKKGIAIMRNGDLGVVFNNGKLILRWKDKVLTKHQGGYSSFFLDGHRFNSITANWRVQVKNEQWIIAKGEWFNVPVTQTWEIRFLDDELQLKITLEGCDKTETDKLQAEFSFTKEYKLWFSSEQKGNFPENFFHEKEYELVHTNESVDKILGIDMCNEKDNKLLPAVIINTFNQKAETVCQAFNSGVDAAARVIRIEALRSRQSNLNSADNHSEIIMNLKFIENNGKARFDEYMHIVKQAVYYERKRRKWKEMEDRVKKFTFKNKQLSISIDENNFLHIYYNNKKLTKNPGIRASFLVGKQWQDSDAKEIRIEKITEDRVKIHNVWKNLPVIQIWDLNMRESGIVDLIIEMEMLYPERISEMNVSIFLKDAYTEWFTAQESGIFDNKFDSWTEIGLKYKGEKSIGAASENLPTIIFDLAGSPKYIPHVFNTDQKFSAHLLQAIAEGKEYQKGKFEYFRGVICVTEDKGINRGKERRFLNFRQQISSLMFDSEYIDGKGIYVFTDRLDDSQIKLSAVIKEAYSKGKVAVAVSRFNFFKLDRIIKFYATFFKKSLNSSLASFSFFPVKSICGNFIDYFKKIKLAADSLGIKLALKDKDLPELISTVSESVTPYNEKELLRLLGVICEHAFIGPEVLVVQPKEYLDTELDFNLYKAIVDNAAELLVDLILLQRNGEPLLDKRFWNMVKYAKDKGIKVSFLTNGILFDKELIKKMLLNIEIESIVCSLPAATAETYAIVNPKQTQLVFDGIVANMKFLVEMRNSSKMTKPVLRINHLIHALNYHELVKMAELDIQIGADKVQFCLMRPLDNSEHLKLKFQQIEMLKKSLEVASNLLRQKNIELDDAINFQLKYYNEDTGDWSKNVLINNGCPVSWFQSLIFDNSQVSMCSSNVINSLSKLSLKEIWNSEKYHYYRIQAKYLKGNKDSTFGNGIKLYNENCEHCDAYGITLRIKKLLKQYNLGKFI